MDASIEIDIDIDDALLERARQLTGIDDISQPDNLALSALIEREAARWSSSRSDFSTR